jgi:cytidine deaminase
LPAGAAAPGVAAFNFEADCGIIRPDFEAHTAARWRNESRFKLTDKPIQELVQAAIESSRHAYIPYSGYTVGAALRAADGTVFGGCNIENAAYSPTICAERTAFAKAISEGQRQFDAIAIVTRDGGSPCGVCRQFMFEFAPELQVILADLGGRVRHVTTLRELLPLGFNSGSLER